MASWQNTPDDNNGVRPKTLVRIKANQRFAAAIISTDILGAKTHYHKSRTVLCTAPVCDACAQMEKPRWYGFLGIWTGVGKPAMLFEFPEGAYDTVAAYREAHGTLRGAKITGERLRNRPNGKVLLTIVPGKYDLNKFPPEFDVKSALCKIWNIHDTTEEQRDRMELREMERKMRREEANIETASPTDPSPNGIPPNGRHRPLHNLHDEKS